MAEAPVVPPGLQDLIPVSQIYVHQKPKKLFQSCCTYDLIGPQGHNLYKAIEKRKFYGPRMDVQVQNMQGYNVFHLHMPASSFSFKTRLQVIDASGHLLGYIEKNLTFSAASFDILNPFKQICLKVKGPGWGEGFMSDQIYQVLSADKSVRVGQITRVWQGLAREMFIQEEKFAVQFPPDLAVSMKAVLIACALMIDLLKDEEHRE